MFRGLKCSPEFLMVLAFCGVTLVEGGCASTGVRPDKTITQAQMEVEQADREGSRNYDAFDLIESQTKLKSAKEKMKQGDYKSARFLAQEAHVDAELALAKTQTAKSKEAETQLKKSLQSLQKEIDRKDHSSTGFSPVEPTDMPN